MTELLTAAQMRAIEQAAIDSGVVTGLKLMERAGQGVVEAVLEWRPALAVAPHRAVVLCGPGNNGGDGFVVARLLKQRGWEVEVFLYGDEAKLPPDAAENCRRWREMGVILPAAQVLDREDVVCDVVVDALFGTGLTRPLEGIVESLADINTHQWGIFRRSRTVAIDVPTGMCSDSGRRLEPEGCLFSAELTVTFHCPKSGHLLDLGPQASGCLHVVDIGLEYEPYNLTPDPIAEQYAKEYQPPACLAEVDTEINKEVAAHKYAYGHTLIAAGPVGNGGAARLAARGALRIGAGLVTVGAPGAAVIENAAHLNAVMVQKIDNAGDLSAALDDARINALCLGPGNGVTQRTKNLVLSALASGRACVLDADALTVFRDAPDDLFTALHKQCVLTPHAGEFKRLFPEISAKLEATPTAGPAYSKLDATREAAELAGCTVLYKGPDTVIADASGRCAINSAHYERAAPWLATAGSGDVLAGFITGLLARGFAPMAAAETAAWLHVECARKFGPGLIAEDLPEHLPGVFRDLGL